MFKKALIASAVLAAAFGAQAQSSAGFGVSGTISPATCGITLTGGGIADFGALVNSTVRTYPVEGAGVYSMGSKQVPIAVTCSAPLKVELAFVDNKAAQRAAVDGNDAIRFGIADGAGTTPAGAYQINMDLVTVDGVTPATYLAAPTGTTAWAATTVGGVPATYAAPGYASGFGTVAGATVPSAVTSIGGSLLFIAYMNKAYVDASTSVITMNGSGTINLQYL